MNVDGPVNLEIFSVGPLFRELDYRELEICTKRTPFFRHEPLFHASVG
ncbi:MAG: hypothetical protein AB1529_04735 [Candidatus Micrarchaeota archaeon]